MGQIMENIFIKDSDNNVAKESMSLTIGLEIDHGEPVFIKDKDGRGAKVSK